MAYQLTEKAVFENLLFISQNQNVWQRASTKELTHVYAHLATDALVVAFAPAFPFVAQRQEKLPQIANAHSLGR